MTDPRSDRAVAPQHATGGRGGGAASTGGGRPDAAADRDRGPSSDHTGAVRLGSASVCEGWADFLGRYQWDVFATLTYSGSVWADEKVLKNFRVWLFRWQVQEAVSRGLCKVTSEERQDGYGRVVSKRKRYRGPWMNNYRKGRGRPTWVLGIEPHKTGKLHAHAVIRWSSLLPDLDRGLGYRLWTSPPPKGFGFGLFARIEPPKCPGDVAGYVSKYVVKGGELVLSPNFDAASLVAA